MYILIHKVGETRWHLGRHIHAIAPFTTQRFHEIQTSTVNKHAKIV